MSNEMRPQDMMKDNPFAAYAAGMTEMQKEALEWMSGGAAPRFAGMANLAAPSMGAMAAASAIGMGMASQMFGMMAGTMAGAMRATEMLASETTGGPPAPFGFANPLNFDWAVGTFDDTKTEDPVTHQPPVKPDAPAKAAEKRKKKPVTAVKPAASAAPVSAKAGPEKAEPVKAVPTASVAAAEPVAVAEAKSAVAEPQAVSKPAVPGAAQPVMPEDFAKPKGMKKPEQPDDLKVISGIGPKLEQVLNGLGVWTYAQIAAWTPEEIAWVDDFLQFKGRIERDGWIGQAAKLAAK